MFTATNIYNLSSCDLEDSNVIVCHIKSDALASTTLPRIQLLPPIWTPLEPWYIDKLN